MCRQHFPFTVIGEMVIEIYDGFLKEVSFLVFSRKKVCPNSIQVLTGISISLSSAINFCKHQVFVKIGGIMLTIELTATRVTKNMLSYNFKPLKYFSQCAPHNLTISYAMLFNSGYILSRCWN